MMHSIKFNAAQKLKKFLLLWLFLHKIHGCAIVVVQSMFFAHGKGERFQFLAPAATYLQNYKQFSISTAAPLVALLAGSTFVVACDAAERVYIWGTLSDTKDAYPKCCKIWDHISLVAAASHFVVAWSDMYAQLKIFGETTITCNKVKFLFCNKYARLVGIRFRIWRVGMIL